MAVHPLVDVHLPHGVIKNINLQQREGQSLNNQNNQNIQHSVKETETRGTHGRSEALIYQKPHKRKDLVRHVHRVRDENGS